MIRKWRVGLSLVLFFCVVLSFAQSQTSVLNARYGALCCKFTNICEGNGDCDGSECATEGAECGTKYDYHHTTSCTAGQVEEGTGCNQGSDYTCWESYKCLCSSGEYKTCSVTGPKKSEKADPIKKKECNP